mmetsp:Transcript_16811/g.38692  ORF Transcript_16811/g.38692 Transcript_16811/m.38692 type:complete len:132 (-) Transcript_16811:1021-1416(-)
MFSSPGHYSGTETSVRGSHFTQQNQIFLSFGDKQNSRILATSLLVSRAMAVSLVSVSAGRCRGWCCGESREMNGGKETFWLLPNDDEPFGLGRICGEFVGTYSGLAHAGCPKYDSPEHRFSSKVNTTEQLS